MAKGETDKGTAGEEAGGLAKGPPSLTVPRLPCPRLFLWDVVMWLAFA